MGSTEIEFNSLAQWLIVTPHEAMDRFVLLDESFPVRLRSRNSRNGRLADASDDGWTGTR